MDLDRIVGGVFKKEDEKPMKKGKARLGGMVQKKKLGRTQMKKLGKTQDLPATPEVETKTEGGFFAPILASKIKDAVSKKGNGPLGGRVLGGRVLGGILGGMSADKMKMLQDVAMRSDDDLEGSGFYSSIGKGLMKRMRTLLKSKEGSAVMGGAVIGGAVIGGAVIGGAKPKDSAEKELVGDMDGGMKPAPAPGKKKRVMSDKMKKRGEMIRDLMKGKGMSLAQASKHIKDNKML